MWDIHEDNPVPAKYYLSDVYLETLRRHKACHAAKGNGFGYEIRDWSDVAGAIVCSGMGRERNLVVDVRQKDLTLTTHIKGEINKEGVRMMTPRECARLQGFPDDFVFPLADVHLYKQLGSEESLVDFNLSGIDKVEIYLNSDLMFTMTSDQFKSEADDLYRKILNGRGGSFDIP